MIVKNLIPVGSHIIVTDMVFNERLSNGGILLLNDDKKSQGIRPRWAKVYAVGPEQKDVKVGQYVMIEHGRWTRGIKVELEDSDEIVVRRIDSDAILLVSDQPQEDQTWGLDETTPF